MSLVKTKIQVIDLKIISDLHQTQANIYLDVQKNTSIPTEIQKKNTLKILPRDFYS